MLWNCSDDFYFSWKSRFGNGIPWWHMQDTSVAMDNFGNGYDIHGGARELSYPHHESHLAQYKLLTKMENPVKIWMHVGLVLSNGEKMSKSLGNVIWSKDFVNKHGQNLLRLYFFSFHYADDIDYTENNPATAKNLLDKILIASTKISTKTDTKLTKLIDEFFVSLDDDLNSPKAITIFENICTGIINGASLSKTDFDHICQTLGIAL